MGFQNAAFKATLVSLLLGVFLAGPVNAARFGKVSVMSEVGAPVVVEIEVMPSEAEAGSLRARVISPPAAPGASADPIGELGTKLEQRGEKRFLRITSDRPLQKADLRVMVELRWSGGMRMGEYLLRFPVSAAYLEQMAEKDRLDVRAFPVASQGIEETPVAEPLALSSTETAPVAAASAGPDAKRADWVVRQGDTLTRVAGSTQYPGLLPEQMFLAIFRANPEAFIDLDAARLIVGKVLAIPDRQTVAATERGEALAFYAANVERLLPAGLASPLPPYVRAADRPGQSALTEVRDGLAQSPASGAVAASEDLSADSIAVSSSSRVAQHGVSPAYASALERDVSDLQKSLGLAGSSGGAGVQKQSAATGGDLSGKIWWVVGVAAIVLCIRAWLKRRRRNAENSI